MARLKFNQHFPPAQERTIRLALEDGLVSDKAQAQVEGLSPRSIGNRWDAIANRLHLMYGRRHRNQVVIELVRSRTVEFLMLALAVLSMFGHGDQIRPRRPPRNPVAQIIKTSRGKDDTNPLANTNFLRLARSAA